MQRWTHDYRFRNKELSAVGPRFPPPPAQRPSATRRPGSHSVVLPKRERPRTATARVGQVLAGIARARRTHRLARDGRATRLGARLPRPAGTLVFPRALVLDVSARARCERRLVALTQCETQELVPSSES